MRGDLSETPAADVCRGLAVDGSTGVLDIEGPEGRGTVVFEGGDVVAATSPTPRARLGDRLVSAGKLDEDALADVLRSQGRDPSGQPLGSLLVDRGLVTYDAVRTVAEEQVIDAVFDIVGWSYGAFRFEPEGELAAVTTAIPVRFAVDHLLVEVARRHEQWHDVRRVIPDLDAVPSFRPGATGAQTSLEPDEFTLLASIDGERNVRELADDLGYGHFEAARIVYGLTLLGIVEVALPEDEVGRALDEALRALTPAEPVDEPTGTPSPTVPVVDPAEIDVRALLAELEGAPLPPRDEVEDATHEVTRHGGAADELAGPRATDEDPSAAHGDAAGDPTRDVHGVDEAGTDGAGTDGAGTDGAGTDEGHGGGPSGALEDGVAAPGSRDVEDAAVPSTDDEVTAAPTRADGAEITALLRELSRLSLEDPQGPDDPPPPSASPDGAEPPPPAAAPKRRDDPPRRRRLFGRG